LEINDDQRRLGPVNKCGFHTKHIAIFHGPSHQHINASLDDMVFILRLD
jgi:hypothetical protein